MNIFITGFPGFIASRLFEKLAISHPQASFYFLCEPRFVFVAARQCQKLQETHQQLKGRWHIVEGDITRSKLAMPEAAVAHLQKSITHVWHLAAVYDLAVPESLAYRVNVEGTQHVLDLCASMPALQRLFYISTCYVAGNRQGRVYEDELDCGQSFKNHYESTKHWAEKQVRHRMSTIPTVIFRPSIVVGDSRSGETHKGDGPYFFMQLLLRLPRAIPMVYLGAMQAPVNLVPVDWLVDAMVALSTDKDAVGQTFQLADPNPMSARQVLDSLIAIIGRARSLGTIPFSWVQPMMSPAVVQRLTGVPAQTLSYFNHPVSYDTSNVARFLADRMDPCPPTNTYLETLVRYAKAHPQVFANVLTKAVSKNSTIKGHAA